VIAISGLTKVYKGNVRALAGIDLEIQPNGMFGLLGVNGAGKTTLMRILAGLLQPTSGTAHVLGHDLRTARGKQAVKAQLGYLPQELGLYPNLTAREFLEYIAILKGIGREDRRRQIEVLLGELRITEVANRPLKTLSGGMKRRVGIAQALLGRPQLLIVDEPTAGLDPEERVRLRNLLAESARDCAVILSTHIVEDIGQSCGDMAVLYEGKVIFRGEPRELIARARGQVWTILNRSGERPNGGLNIISTLQMQDGVQYRVLGQPEDSWQAVPAEPSLEDGYICLMKQSRGE
jgi:ABC-2 type transport system ATP-binding protein